MRLYVDGISDELFVGLWVSVNYKGNIKDLGYKPKSGITDRTNCNKIRSDYEIFNSYKNSLSYYSRLENFFNCNYAVVSTLKKDEVTFQYTSASWNNIIFFRSRKYGDKYQISKQDLCLISLFPILSKNDSLVDISFTQIFKIYQKNAPSVPFDRSNLSLWEKALDRHIVIFDLNEDGKIHKADNMISPVLQSKYTSSIMLVVNDRSLVYTEDAKYRLLTNSKLMISNYKCQLPGCYYIHSNKSKVKRHQATCGNHIVTSKQRTYGNPESMLEYGVRIGYIPKKWEGYRQKYFCCFDIETLESSHQGDLVGYSTTIEHYHNTVSIAIGSNIPNYEPIFLMRKSSEPEAEQDLITEFVKHLDELHATYITQLPAFIQTALDRLDGELGEETFSKDRCKKSKLRTHLNDYKKLRIFGFNSSKFLYNYIYQYYSVVPKFGVNN